MAEVMMAKAKPKGDFILPHLSLPFLPSKHKKKKEKQEYDELGENNLAGISGLGEVGRPDWMEQVDSSDDDNGGLMKDRTNFDLKKNKIDSDHEEHKEENQNQLLASNKEYLNNEAYNNDEDFEEELKTAQMQARQKQEHILNESSSIQNQLKQERSEITDNRTTN